MTQDGNSAPLDPEIAEANRRKAKADALTSELALQKAQREENEAATPLARQQRDADTRKAIAEARKAARDAAVHVDPALARQQKEAEANKATAEASKVAAEARQAEVAALIPDFSKVQVSETKLQGDQPLFSSVLAHHAVARAAEHIVDAVLPKLKELGSGAVLITSDPDLATADAAYVEVSTGIDRLIEAADAILAPPQGHGAGFAAAAAAAAFAGALPGLVSMVVPRTTVSSYAVQVDTTAAIAEVAGRLSGQYAVRLDDFRLVPQAAVVNREGDLRHRRSDLLRRKVTREAEKSKQDTIVAERQQELEELLRQRDEAPGQDSVVTQIRQVGAARDAASVAARSAATEASVVDDLLKSIDAFSVAIHSVPAGGTRSPFVAAALHEELRTSHGDPRFVAVLFVKASSGSVDQLFKDRLFVKDKFEGIASVSLSYWLMTAADSLIRAAGVASGSARIRGQIGGQITIEPVTEL